MSGPVYLVVGATGGIGSALSRRLVERGGRVFLAARTESALRALSAELDSPWRVVDATDGDAVSELVDHVIETMGRLDGVASLAGSMLLKPAHLTKPDELAATLDANVATAFNVLRASVAALRDTDGSVVLFSSAAALTGLPNHEAIAAAKGAVAALVRSAASTYARWGVRVNAVAPGLVETPLTERITSRESARKHSESLHPLGRLGRAEEPADVAAWLLDGQTSGWVTGQVIAVDGGLSMVRPG